jgi:hypothetical protein
MNNADMPAKPTQATLNREQDKFLETQTGNNDFLLLGLTKREHFAGLAMQSLLAAIPAWEAMGYPCPTFSEIAIESYKMADVMFDVADELDKVKS